MSEQMEHLLDVESLLKEQVWEMLRKRVKAFTFDRRLENHSLKVQIQTVDSRVLILVLIYNSSPAKKAVIEKQLKKWFKLGVIKPLNSSGVLQWWSHIAMVNLVSMWTTTS
ncbi:hypothetical protein HWV62_19525 [Athelia sp. TMB]|nr:hypothetical protein HWV62_19525 [Athelia sp. TMB]